MKRFIEGEERGQGTLLPEHHPHVALACAASRKLQRPVKVSLTRPQTFTGYGGRPRASQGLALGRTRTANWYRSSTKAKLARYRGLGDAEYAERFTLQDSWLISECERGF